jgi:glutamine synthetase adenylyltransferase
MNLDDVSRCCHQLIRFKLFRLWLGAAEYLFRKPELLDECIDTAIEDNTFRADDLEFTFAARVRRLAYAHVHLLTSRRIGHKEFC